MDTNLFKAELVALLPKLRGLAMVLTGSAAAADDLVQDTMVRAWRFREGFQEGSNMAAWVNRILRNTFYTAAAARRNVVQDVDGKYAAQLSCKPEQEWRVKYGELLSALRLLTPEAREALLLVAAEGLSYEEAAGVVGCPVGTLKSRVNRARERLAELIDVDLPKANQRAALRAAPAAAAPVRNAWAPTANAA
ncbi:sigma-70 family RNA polymerase sigma factor [Phenylobacterium sp.]|jgi:RNA polymerase sigma-70 factor (ECF subfamily)|uniref:sigma-70 family RNA polymerase sigma factor n=1 Tax=Phenylobacterium sp. TaxID=1871053 RepID=UPI002F413820